MSHLERFVPIIQDKDFTFISSKREIDKISRIFLYGLTHPSRRDTLYKEWLTQYLRHLRDIYWRLDMASIGKAREGYMYIIRSVEKAISILESNQIARSTISGGYRRKFRKEYLKGLSIFLTGLREAFDPENISSTGITKQQLIRFILDDKEGLGTSNTFNAVGKYAPLQHFTNFKMQELLVALRLLCNQSHHARSLNGWRDLGSGRDPVRLLLVTRMVRKSRVFFVFRLDEHTAYERYVHETPGNFSFRPA